MRRENSMMHACRPEGAQKAVLAWPSAAGLSQAERP